MYKFTGFTEKANRALNSAIEIAENFGHTYIGTEHLLGGLVREDNGVGTKILLKQGITLSKVEQQIRRGIGVGIPTILTPDDFTPKCKYIIEEAISLARSKNSGGYVGTEHLLAALLTTEDCYGVKIIREIGANLSPMIAELNGESEFYASGRNKTQKTKSSTPTLDSYSQDLTAKAREGKIDPVIGRNEEIARVIQILTRRTKNNPCLIGEPGVGKTAIAEGLALKIACGEVPEILKDKRVVSLDLTGVVAGTKYRGDFEERIKGCIDEVIKAGDVILFIDEVHNLIGTGSAEGAVDAANILKPSLARSELQVIGATTINEYRKNIEKDSALERRFQSVKVGEPSVEETIEILRGIRDKYEAHHKVKITDGAIKAAAEMSKRYISDRFLPDKAIDLIDEACSKVRLKSYTVPPEIDTMEKELKDITEEKASAINSQDFENAAALRDREKQLMSQITAARALWKEESAHDTCTVAKEDVAQILSGWTGIPVSEITVEQAQRLLKLEEVLHERIIGQEKAVTAVAKAIRRGRSGLSDPKKPLGSFIFLGPTGVGKTELCKALGAAMFGDENAVVRFDMSEFMEKHNTSRLVGSPPGYVGYDEGGELTEKIRRKPYSIVLFDEIEKAHPDVFNMLLQILDDGILTDSQGRRVDFRNTVIIMTSNLGAKLIADEGKSIGFSGSGEKGRSEENIRSAVMNEVKKTFRPEFLNRIDEIIIFSQLKKEEIEKIAEKLLHILRERMKALGVEIEFSPEIISMVAEEGFDPIYGARPLKRAIQRKIEDTLSEKLLAEEIKEGKKYLCCLVDGEIIISEKEEM